MDQSPAPQQRVQTVKKDKPQKNNKFKILPFDKEAQETGLYNFSFPGSKEKHIFVPDQQLPDNCIVDEQGIFVYKQEFFRIVLQYCQAILVKIKGIYALHSNKFEIVYVNPDTWGIHCLNRNYPMKCYAFSGYVLNVKVAMLLRVFRFSHTPEETKLLSRVLYAVLDGLKLTLLKFKLPIVLSRPESFKSIKKDKPPVNKGNQFPKVQNQDKPKKRDRRNRKQRGPNSLKAQFVQPSDNTLRDWW
jgi:hypothetical protein